MKIFITSLLCLALLAGLVSCGKESENGGGSNTLDVNSVTNSKWVMESGSDFASIELNKSGNFIAVRTADKRSGTDDVIFGTYRMVGQTIVLEGLGTITFSVIKANEITFTLTLTGGGTPINLSAEKAEEMASTPKTDLLCRTWELVSIDGVDVKGTEDEGTVLFSRAGTYLLTLPDGTIEMPQWRWAAGSQTIFEYSWNNWGVGSPGENGSAEILNLTSTNLTVLDDGSVWLFKGI